VLRSSDVNAEANLGRTEQRTQWLTHWLEDVRDR
jgi:ribosome modulation factor